MKKQSGNGGVELIVALMLLAVVMLALFMVKSYSCRERAYMMKLESRYGLFTGCMVRVDDRWAPLSYIRIVDGKVQIYGDGE